jgi:predicted NBD/HSP70 family sugar kinase
VLELSAGHIATSWDSSLGFRHGPKAIVRAGTLIFLLISSNPHARRYDEDLAEEIERQFGAATLVRLGPADTSADIEVHAVDGDAWNAVLYVIVAQMLAAGWSQRLGLNVDDPFAGKNLTRVVSDVRIYPVPPAQPGLVGAIDLGGSKIEACLFDSDLERVASLRVGTPRDNYRELLDAIVGQVQWLDGQAGRPVPIGIGIPGVIDPRTGNSNTANLPATGRALSADLSSRLGRAILVENDCKCLALSEANGGAGAPFKTVFGLVLGTGVGGGVCINGALVKGQNGLPGEVGHIGIPATLIAAHDLPLVKCGCGWSGCYETLLSGPGMSRLAHYVAGRIADPAEIIRLAGMGDSQMRRVVAIWQEIACELIATIQLTIDADCVVIGGGLSRTEGLAGRLKQAFGLRAMQSVQPPEFRIARFGDASGVRGAAMLARHAAAAESL